MNFLTLKYEKEEEIKGNPNFLITYIKKQLENKSISLPYGRKFKKIVNTGLYSTNSINSFILSFVEKDYLSCMSTCFFLINEKKKEIYFYIPDLIDLKNNESLEIIYDRSGYINAKVNNRIIFIASINKNSQICSALGNSNSLRNLRDSKISKEFFNFILKVINRAGFFNSNFIDFTMPNNYHDLVNIIRKYYNFKESIPFTNFNSGNDLIYFYNDKVEFLKLK
jgi:hypothetical protein